MSCSEGYELKFCVELKMAAAHCTHNKTSFINLIYYIKLELWPELDIKKADCNYAKIKGSEASIP